MRASRRSMSATESRSRHRSGSTSNQPVEQMTWDPGQPMLIRDRLIAEGGCIDRPGSTIFNLYRPPLCLPGDPGKAEPGSISPHVYPDDADHILRLARPSRAEAGREDQPRAPARRRAGHRQGHDPASGELRDRRVELRRGDAGPAARPLQRLHQKR